MTEVILVPLTPDDREQFMAWKTVKGSYPDTEHVKFQTGYRNHGYEIK